MVESDRGLNRSAGLLTEVCTNLEFEIGILVLDDVLGHVDPLTLLLHA